MKKILSLVMVVAMLVAVLALVGCNDTKPANTTTAGTTTAGTTTADTTTAGTTTADTTTAGTTTADTTTAGTTAADTTTAGTTTADTTTAGTTTADTTTADTTTLPPVFARFDFGTASKAEDLGMTSHAYLVEALKIDENFINVTYTDDSIIVTAVQNHPEIKTKIDEDGDRVEDAQGYASNSYALNFDDLMNYEFDDILQKDKDFIKVRVKNNSNNNMMAFHFKRGSDAGYSTRQLATCMYLQGGAPTVDDYVNGNHKLVADAADTEFKTYTYDINFLATMGRNNTTGDASGKSYVHMAYYVGLGGGIGGNNWAWSGTQEIVALRFYVLGAYGGPAYCPAFDYGDSRAFIEEGDSIEIDYIIFGAKNNLKTFTSYAEDAYNESVSISKSISVAESEAAATATTAAA